MSLIERDKKYVWHPFTQHQGQDDPLQIVEAEGTLLFDENGKSYIDANSSWWVNVHGHAHPRISKALKEQFEKLDHVVFAGVTHPKAVELAERIASSLSGDFGKVFFSDNGSTAVEVGIKMAFQYWYNKGIKKNKVVALEGAYHGDTFGAMSVGQRGYFNKPFEDFFFDVDYIDFPSLANAELVLEQAEQYFSKGNVASFIVEPLVQGAAGMKMYSTEILDQLVEVARKHQVLVIFDEVMTGFGRTGSMYAVDQCSNKPDIVALSKGLTAGVMALGLTVATNEVFDSFLDDEMSKAFLHGHSFTANPLACAVACANLDIFDEAATSGKIESLEQWHQTFSENLKMESMATNIRITGTILAFEVQVGEEGYFSDIKSKAYNYFLAKGILLRPLGSTIFINPPYCITHDQYKQIEEAVISFLRGLEK